MESPHALLDKNALEERICSLESMLHIRNAQLELSQKHQQADLTNIEQLTKKNTKLQHQLHAAFEQQQMLQQALVEKEIQYNDVMRMLNHKVHISELLQQQLLQFSNSAEKMQTFVNGHKRKVSPSKKENQQHHQSLHSALDRLKLSVTILTQENSNSKSYVQKLHQQILDLEASLKQRELALTNTEYQLENANSELCNSKTQIVRLQAQNEQLQAQLDGSNTIIAEFQDEIVNIKVQHGDLVLQHQSSKDQLQVAKQQLDCCENEKKTLESRNDDITVNLMHQQSMLKYYQNSTKQAQLQADFACQCLEKFNNLFNQYHIAVQSDKKQKEKQITEAIEAQHVTRRSCQQQLFQSEQNQESLIKHLSALEDRLLQVEHEAVQALQVQSDAYQQRLTQAISMFTAQYQETVMLKKNALIANNQHNNNNINSNIEDTDDKEK